MTPLRIGSFCSGAGGLDLAVEELAGGEVAWFAETDAHASTVLAAHWPGVPNHGDLTTFDWTTAEPIDVLCAGFPCQPVSSAGKRKAMADERWLWDDITRAVRDMAARPGWIFLENVRGLLTAGGGLAMGHVLHDLAHLGYVGRYGLLPASAVGSPHRRERVFIVAAHPERQGLQGHRRPLPDGPCGQVEALPDAGPRTAMGTYGEACTRWAHLIGRWWPDPFDAHGPNPRFSEWLMGLPDGWICDHVGWADALRLAGNGVVARAALTAYRSLTAGWP